MDSADQFVLTLGAVADDARRPAPIALRPLRSWHLFHDKESALAWARRHAPALPTGCVGCSAHPRPIRVATGEYALRYDITLTVPRKAFLRRDGRLEVAG